MPTDRRICILTSAHLTTCPRMLKAADALVDEGYPVDVISILGDGWAASHDSTIARQRGWEWKPVLAGRRTGFRHYIRSGVRYRCANWTVRRLGGADGVPASVVSRAFGRFHSELVRAAGQRQYSLIYGGTAGGVMAVAEAAMRAGCPYGVDFEDFHRGEHAETNADGRLRNGMARRIEEATAAGASFITAGSAAIAEEYEKHLHRPVTAVHNTFTLPRETPAFSHGSTSALRLYWFSQTIGPKRGLEDILRAAVLAKVPVSIDLRGAERPGYMASLRAIVADASSVTLRVHGPAPPDQMVDLCRGSDIGLSLEDQAIVNRDLCLTNKAFVYLLAGLAVVMTETKGHRLLAGTIGDAALRYRAGDVEALAAVLRRWWEHPVALDEARRASWKAARTRWHWEHACERGALLRAVASVVGHPGR